MSRTKNSQILTFLTLMAFCLQGAFSPVFAYSYEGLEYFGSSQLTRQEIEKYLHLSQGASIKRIEKSVDRLQKKIDDLKLFANIEIVTASDDRAYVSVDLIEQEDDMIPTRKLTNPHHVATRSEKPEILLAKLEDRLNQLNMEGRAWKPIYKGGMKFYTDEPANQIVEEIRRFAPTMKPDWIEVVACDPDPDRRVMAIELLGWSGSYADTCYKLIGAMDDSNYKVRAKAARFIYKRLDILPHDFPYQDLIHALCRQVRRPSHEDRVKSTYLMYEVLNKRPLLTGLAKQGAEKYINLYSSKSRIPSLRNVCERLRAKFSQPLPSKRTKLSKPRSSGF